MRFPQIKRLGVTLLLASLAGALVLFVELVAMFYVLSPLFGPSRDTLLEKLIERVYLLRGAAVPGKIAGFALFWGLPAAACAAVCSWRHPRPARCHCLACGSPLRNLRRPCCNNCGVPIGELPGRKASAAAATTSEGSSRRSAWCMRLSAAAVAVAVGIVLGSAFTLACVAATDQWFDYLSIDLLSPVDVLSCAMQIFEIGTPPTVTAIILHIAAALAFFTIPLSITVTAAYIGMLHILSAPAPFVTCRSCGHILMGLSSPRCPECGCPL